MICSSNLPVESSTESPCKTSVVEAISGDEASRSFSINGQLIEMSMPVSTWRLLQFIADDQRTTIDALMGELVSLQPRNHNLKDALEVFIVLYFDAWAEQPPV